MNRVTRGGMVAILVLASPAYGGVGTISQQAYIKASNSGMYDQFGGSGTGISLSGDTLVVGAPGEDSSAKEVNGDQGDGLDPTPRNPQSGLEAGAAYVFTRHGSGWSQEAYLKSTDTAGHDLFGRSVAVSGDTVVVSAPGADGREGGVYYNGAVYVFVREGKTWRQEARLTAPGRQGVSSFGGPVAICGDTLVVGVDGDPWEGKPGEEGELMAGAVYVFVREDGKWSRQARLQASNPKYKLHFGGSVAVSGDTLIVGAIGDDSAAGGVDGESGEDQLSNSGAAYVFVRKGKEWSQQAYLKATEPGEYDEFGGAVALSADTAVVGAKSARVDAKGGGRGGDDDGPGAAWVFVRDGETWSVQACLTPPDFNGDDEFGASVAVSGDGVVIGAPMAGDSSTKRFETAGAAWVYRRNDHAWDEGTRIMASNAYSGNRFGGSVAISGGTVVAGAAGEGGFARGVNGDQGPGSYGNRDSGAAYVFIGVGGAAAGDGTDATGGGALEEKMFGYWGVDTDAMTDTLKIFVDAWLAMAGIGPDHKDRAAEEKEQMERIKAEFENVTLEIRRGEMLGSIYPGNPEPKTYRVLSSDGAAGTLELEVSSPAVGRMNLRATPGDKRLAIAGEEDGVEMVMVYERIDEATFRKRARAVEEKE